jgi:diadenosine tetraphosphate (Ap4A) HIT family hydrolase
MAPMAGGLTWPADWAERRRGAGCPMCAEGRPEESHDGARVFAGRCIDAYLSRHDAQPGYTVVVWRGRHVAEPTELTAEEASCYWQELLTVARALEEQFRPAKTNYQILGNAVPHLHTHVILRYEDDPEPGRPLSWPRGDRPAVPAERFAAEVAALRARLRPEPFA